MSHEDNNQDNQGEGNREAAREYNERTRAFVNSERGREAMERHPGGDSDEARRAERAGAARAVETDPAVTRDYDDATNQCCGPHRPQ